MSGSRDSLAARIKALDREGADREWTVETTDGRVVSRCHSHDDAMDLRALIVRLSREETLGLKVSSRSVTPDYVEQTGLRSADSRFCDWALMRLGRVLIETSPGDTGSRFLVRDEEGHSGEGRTLACALFCLLKSSGNE